MPMSLVRRLSLPLLIIAVPSGFAVWAFPEALSPLRAVAIVSGWIGCGLLLVSLLLMLREPRLAAALGGLDRMYRWHHRAGIAAYVLLLMHPLLLAADALGESPAMAWETLAPQSESWPVWAGWLSLLLLMAGLAAAFMRGIPYRIWLWLHAGLGAAVLIGLYHLILLGIDEPVLPIMAAAAFIMAWRGLRSDWGLSARPYIVAASRRIGARTVEINLRPLAVPLTVTPGQFILVAFFSGPGFRGCGEFHPFSVSAIDDDSTLHVAVSALGDCTRHMQSIVPGIPARVQGAFGGLFDERGGVPQLWVAGGIGITPFLSALRLGAMRHKTTLLYLYRNESDAVFLPELRQMAASDPLLSLKLVETGDSKPELARLLPAGTILAGTECYLCGPPALVAATKQALRGRGVTARQIHFENFDFR